MILRSFIWRFVIPGFTALVLTSAANAQSTIFNVPNTDVMPKGKLYVEADFIAHIDKFEKGGFQSYGYRAVYGVTKKLEAGVNFFYTRDGVSSAKELQLNAKYQLYNNEKHGVAVSVGGWSFTPLNRSSGRRTTGMVYSTVSKSIRKLRGTRLTGGAYQMINTRQDDGAKQGWIVGVEVPLYGNLSFTGDWFSGNNRFGYASAGLSYTFAERHFIQAGYSWGNNGRGNNALQIFYGLTF
jgi:hypothetical protein